ncbi:hypothetical protein DRP07_02245 [Archaeoglobales archaeon]|nr:MAG: hypothetical protein DRP07_02245 [Archaeoglobales archaeon]
MIKMEKNISYELAVTPSQLKQILSLKAGDVERKEELAEEILQQNGYDTSVLSQYWDFTDWDEQSLTVTFRWSDNPADF